MIEPDRAAVIEKYDTLLTPEEHRVQDAKRKAFLQPLFEVLQKKNYIDSSIDYENLSFEEESEILEALYQLYLIIQMIKINTAHEHMFHYFEESQIFEVFGKNVDVSSEEKKKEFVKKLMEEVL